MLDIKFIRENVDLIKEAARKKRVDFDVDELVTADQKRLEILSVVESLRTKQNLSNDKMTKITSDDERHLLIAEMRELKEELKEKEEKLREVIKEWQGLMLKVPNIPDMSVPEGQSDAENVEERVWGEKPVFNFTPKNYMDLMNDHDMVDIERGTKVSGYRGYFLKNEGAMLAFALWQLFIERLTQKGFIPMIVPSLVKKETLFGTGYLPQGEEDLYATKDDMYLAGTGEVATMSYYQGEILSKLDLPKKFLAFSPCFRREAGSHGRDEKGIFRIHEFMKLEQVVLCEASHEQSVKFHEEITSNVEEILQEIGLPYHIVVNCGGDLGLGQVKKYDLEVWMPSQDTYRETHSASYFHDFQTRRLNIRYREDDGKINYVHSLNNTAVATPRIIANIVENFQQEDGSIKIPKVLQKYMGGRETIKKM